MRIKAYQIAQYLKNRESLHPFYCIFGEEPFQQMEARTFLIKKFVAFGYLEHHIFELSKEEQWLALINQPLSLSLFSSKEVIEARVPPGKMLKKNAEFLTTLQKNLTNRHVVLFIFNQKLDTVTQQSKWFKDLEKEALILTANPLSSGEFSPWVLEQCKLKKIHFNQSALNLFLKKMEGNLLKAAQTIEILSLCYPNPSDILNEQQILPLLGEDALFSLYSLMDAILHGEIERTIQIFYSLIYQETDLILILWVILKEVRTIIPLARLKQSGALKPQAFEAEGIWQSRVASINQFLNRIPYEALHDTLLKAKIIDNLIKQNLQLEAKNHLLSLIIMLCGNLDQKGALHG